jgi:hypothetical protein
MKNYAFGFTVIKGFKQIDIGLLDTYPNALAAYSLRLLRSGYSGNCIRARRSSDNNEQNIGFLNNIVNISDVQNFANGGQNAFVHTLYDQSGSARDLVQSNASNQIQILNNSNPYTFNSKYSFNGVANSFYQLNQLISGNFTFAAVVEIPNGTQYLFDGGNTSEINRYGVILDKGNGQFIYISSDNSGSGASGSLYPIPQSIGAQIIICGVKNGANSEIFINGVSIGTTTLTTDDASILTLFSRVSNGANFTAKFQEFVVWNSLINLTDLSNELNNFYNVY